jgi:hypothetical protein
MTTHHVKTNHEKSDRQLVRMQEALCTRIGSPLWIPSNAVCWSCRFPIFNNVAARFNAGTKVITACPDCKRSFCD